MGVFTGEQPESDASQADKLEQLESENKRLAKRLVNEAIKWAVIENIVILCVICFLCYLFTSGWPLVLLVFYNTIRRRV